MDDEQKSFLDAFAHLEVAMKLEDDGKILEALEDVETARRCCPEDAPLMAIIDAAISRLTRKV